MTTETSAQRPAARRAGRTASDAIAEDIRADIASGALRPGDRLPSERLLLERYAVARPTMRGALRILESDGLVRIERGIHGGARVMDDPDLSSLSRRIGLHLQLRGADLRDLFDAQAALQPRAAALAATAHDAGDLARLHAAVQRCADADSVDDFVSAVAAFGTAVLAASHNRVLALYGEVTTSLLAQVLSSYADQAGITLQNAEPAVSWARTQFTAVVGLIAAGDATAAEAFWSERLAEAAASAWPAPSPFQMYPASDRT
jgi:DNA-binding FadR family transcriptional regulator